MLYYQRKSDLILPVDKMYKSFNRNKKKLIILENERALISLNGFFKIPVVVVDGVYLK